MPSRIFRETKLFFWVGRLRVLKYSNLGKPLKSTFVQAQKKKKKKNLGADLGCRRNISIYAHPLVSGRIKEIRHVLALCWCPGVVVFPTQFALHIFYKQPQRILPIWDVLQCDFCMLAE